MSSLALNIKEGLSRAMAKVAEEATRRAGQQAFYAECMAENGNPDEAELAETMARINTRVAETVRRISGVESPQK